MVTKKETALARAKATDPLTVLRQATAEIDRMFDKEFRWPAIATRKQRPSRSRRQRPRSRRRKALD